MITYFLFRNIAGPKSPVITLEDMIVLLQRMPRSDFAQAFQQATAMWVVDSMAGTTDAVKYVNTNAADPSRVGLRLHVHNRDDSGCDSRKRKGGQGSHACKRARGTHEGSVKALLDTLVHDKKIPMYIYNKKFVTGIKPDFVWIGQNLVVVFECDERQHKGYNRDGEVLRETRMLKGCNGKPLILVRYNPDYLSTPNTADGQAGVVVATTREEVMANLIQKVLNAPPPTVQLTHYKLFYDCGCPDDKHCGYVHMHLYENAAELLEKGIGLKSLLSPTCRDPSPLLCPITYEIMRDPVVDPDGYSYERSAIELWLRTDQTSPVTRNPLTASMLIPNRALACMAHMDYTGEQLERTDVVNRRKIDGIYAEAVAITVHNRARKEQLGMNMV